MGQYEEKRLAGRFTHSDSVRWLNALKPGLEVVWTDPSTERVEFALTAASPGDTILASILGTYGSVRESDPVSVGGRRESLYRWNLRDNAGEKVEPGVYCVHFVRGQVATLFYVVIQGR